MVTPFVFSVVSFGVGRTDLSVHLQFVEYPCGHHHVTADHILLALVLK